MVSCVAIGCKNRSIHRLPNVSFHRFPLDPGLRRAWTKAVGRKNWTPAARSALCSLHFLDVFFKNNTKHRRRLKDYAIPSIFGNCKSQISDSIIVMAVQDSVKNKAAREFHDIPTLGVSQVFHPTVIVATKAETDESSTAGLSHHSECAPTTTTKSRLSVMSASLQNDQHESNNGKEKKSVIVKSPLSHSAFSDECDQVTTSEFNVDPIVLNEDLSGSDTMEEITMRVATTFPQSKQRKTSHNTSSNSHKKKTCYECNICQRKFIKTSRYKYHLRTHTGEKPYECSWEGCGKKFSRSDDASRHEQIHTGERNFFCTLCFKKFKRKDHVVKHFDVHIREFQKPDFPLDDTDDDGNE